MIPTADPDRAQESDFQTFLWHWIHLGIGSSGGADSNVVISRLQ